MAVKPWLGAIKEPQNFKPLRLFILLRLPEKKPNVNLKINYVYGYRAKDCRNNLYYLDDDRIVYHAAAVGIVLNPKDNN